MTMEKLNREDLEKLDLKTLEDLLVLAIYNKNITYEVYESYFKSITCYFPRGSSGRNNLEEYLKENYKKRLSVRWLGNQGFVGETIVTVFKQDYELVKQLIGDKYGENVLNN